MGSNYELSWYINPHLFWLRSKSVLESEAFTQFEHKLDEYYKLKTLPDHLPMLGQKVAYFDRHKAKWYRAVVDHIYNGPQGNQSYILWLIDYGRPTFADKKSIKELKTRFKDVFNNIIKAGVYGVLPAKIINYDFVCETTHKEITNSWDEIVVTNIQHILEEASVIKLKEICTYQEKEIHYFSKVMISTKDGVELDLAKSIVKSPFATKIHNATEFLNVLTEINTIKMKRFENNKNINIFQTEEITCETRNPNAKEQEAIPRKRYDRVETQHLYKEHKRTKTRVSKVKEKTKTVETRTVKKISSTQDMPQLTPVNPTSRDSTSTDSSLIARPDGAKKVIIPDPVVDRPKMPNKKQTVNDNKMNETVFYKPTATPKERPLPQKTDRMIEDNVKQFFENCKIPNERKANNVKISKAPRTINIVPACIDQVTAAQQRRKAAFPQASVVNIPKEVKKMSEKPSRYEKPASVAKKSNPFFDVFERIAAENRKMETETTSDDGSVARHYDVGIIPTSAMPLAPGEQFQECGSKFHDGNSVLVHGKRPTKCISSTAEAQFHPDVMTTIKRHLKEIRRIQAYAWPHILHENSTILVGGPASGKTRTLIPTICTLVINLIEDKLVPDTAGPVAIIVSPFVNGVSEIVTEIGHSLRYWHEKLRKRQDNLEDGRKTIITESYGRANQDKITNELLRGTGIFVVTPPALARWIDKWKANGMPLFNDQRLKIFAVDDFDTIYNRYGTTISEQIELFCGKTKEKSLKQLIITSTQWLPQLHKYSHFGKNPELVISNYIEAGIYGKTQFRLNFTKREAKSQYVEQFLDGDTYKRKRSLIICSNDEEVNDICDHLKTLDVKFKFFTQTIDESSRNAALTWYETPPTEEFTVLVCSDAVLVDLSAMKNVQRLLNYSLPDHWSALSIRFSVLFDTFHDYVQNIKTPSTYQPSFTQILVDETNCRTLPRFVDFLKRIDAKIPTEVNDLAHKMLSVRQGDQASHNLCPFFLHYGIKLNECDRKCGGRHALSTQDAPTERMPAVKTILKLKITVVHNPIHFSAQILGYRRPTERNFHDWKNENQIIADADLKMQIQMYFANEDNKIAHYPVNKGDLCAYHDGEHYYRMQVLQISGKTGVNEKPTLTIRLIDIGEIRTRKTDEQILVLPEKFKSIPPRAIDFHHMNLNPYDSDLHWSSLAREKIKKLVQLFNEKSGDQHYVKANVVFRVENNVWCDKITLCDGTYETWLLKSLVKDMLAEEVDETPLDILEKMYDDLGFNELDDDEEEEQPVVELTPKPTTPESDPVSEMPRATWDYLSSDSLHEIEIPNLSDPSEFYLNRSDNVKKHDELCNLIDNFDTTDACQLMTDPKPNTNCLIPLKEGLARGRIIECGRDEKGDYCRVFKCDYGNPDLFDYNEIYKTNKEIIEFMPFTAIQGTFAGIIPIEGDAYDDASISGIWKILENAQKSGKLYAYVVGIKPSLDWLPGIYRYDLLLIEKSNDGLIKLLNHELVSKGLAKWDEDAGPGVQKLTMEYFQDFREFLKNDDDIEETKEWEDAVGTYEHPKEPPKEETKSLKELMKALECPDDLSEDEMKIEMYRLMGASDAEIAILQKIHEKTNNTEQLSLPAIKAKAAEKIINTSNPLQEIPQVDHVQDDDRIIDTSRQSTILWQQDHTIVVLSIHVGDSPDYHLEVHASHMIFAHFVSAEEEPRLTVVNFFSTIKPEYVSHQIRGLNLVIRLPKVTPNLLWSRLTNEKTKNSYIKYNLDTMKPLDDNFIPIKINKKKINDSDDDDDDSDNKSINGYENDYQNDSESTDDDESDY